MLTAFFLCEGTVEKASNGWRRQKERTRSPTPNSKKKASQGCHFVAFPPLAPGVVVYRERTSYASSKTFVFFFFSFRARKCNFKS